MEKGSQDSIKTVQRIARVMYNKAGGNASKNAVNTRVSLPKTWLDEMGINENARSVILTYTNGKIIIEKSDS